MMIETGNVIIKIKAMSKVQNKQFFNRDFQSKYMHYNHLLRFSYK